jgi:hypothetical protein
MSATTQPTTFERVERVLKLIRPAVQADGGDVELVGVTAEGIAEGSTGVRGVPFEHDHARGSSGTQDTSRDRAGPSCNHWGSYTRCG